MTNYLKIIWNLLLVYAVYWVCRVVFCLENDGTLLNDLSLNAVWGCFVFDTSAILYTNILYIFMVLLPLHWKENKTYHLVAKVVFVVVNTICIIANLADSVYFQYSGRRTTISVFQQFSNENNIWSIIKVESIHHWYLVLLAIALSGALVWAYKTPCFSREKKAKYYLGQTLALLIFAPLCVIGMRGGISAAAKPITIIHAHQYASHPSQAAAIINTPFAFIRTISKKPFTDPGYFDRKETENLGMISPHKSLYTTNQKKNIVVIVMESFGKEYIGAYNDYEGFTPFLDSLINVSLSYRYSFSNARVSMEGLPAVFSSIPMFNEAFFLTDATLNTMSGIARELANEGYETAFFHGADNTSMGIHAFMNATGFKHYYGRTEFGQDERFRGDKEFDGKWAIWDEPFLNFTALHISDLQEPFVAGIFTATSHHPYILPEEYQDIYKEESLPIYKCVRYADNSLRKFFDEAKKHSWYENSLFVITADHTNISEHPEYQTDLGKYSVPIIFFDPQGELPTGIIDSVAQQTDIMPTILSYLQYDKPFVGFGKDLWKEPKENWMINFNNGVYQYIKDNYLLIFDGTKTTAIYDYRNDPMLEHNLKESTDLQEMEREAKAIIQSYMERMIEDRLVVGN